MKRENKIVELMKVPTCEHDCEWLKQGLQAAIEVEFGTIPPYLAAYWSVKKRGDPVADSIRTIVREEMLHMGLICNLLVGIDETPQFNVNTVPTYPGPIHGGVHPELEVPLQGLSKEAAELFMKIEYPEFKPVAFRLGETYPTIGDFYSAIQTAFETLKPTVSIERQLAEDTIELGKIPTLAAVQEAIQLIKRQGEGCKESPADTGDEDLAHYYRFGEIYHEKRLKKDPKTGKWDWIGANMLFPECWPMGKVPCGGYQKPDVAAEVSELLEKFDHNFTAMVNHLQLAWQNGNSASLDDAVDDMRNLRTPAVALMKIPIPSRTTNYGPCFRLVKMA